MACLRYLYVYMALKIQVGSLVTAAAAEMAAALGPQ